MMPNAVIEEWWTAHARRLYDAALRLSGDASAAEDLRSETFLRALRSDFSGSCAPYTYLYGIMRHLFVDARRRAARGGGPALELIDAVIPGPHPEPDAPACAAEAETAVHEAIGTLSTPLRAAVELFYFAGASCKRGAADLSIPQGTFQVRLHNARRALRGALPAFASGGRA